MYERCELVGVAQPPTDDKTGVSSGYYGTLGAKHYAPCFVLPDADYYPTFRIHNLTDQSGGIYLIVTSIFSASEQYVDVFKYHLDAYGYTDIQLACKERRPHVLVLEVGWETTAPESPEPPYVRKVNYQGQEIKVFITHRQTLIIHIGGYYPSEEFGSDYEVCYYYCDYILEQNPQATSNVDPYEPYPIVGSIRIFVDAPSPYYAVPVFRFGGQKKQNVMIYMWNFNRGATKKFSGKFAYITAEDMSDFETAFDDVSLGYDEISAFVVFMKTIMSVEMFNCIILYALGAKPEWWNFTDWKADDAHSFAIGDPPQYIEVETKFAVVRVGTPSESDLLKSMEEFDREVLTHGMPLYSTNITYKPSELGWGGFITITSTSPAYEGSPIGLFLMFLIGVIAVAGAIIGIIVAIYYAYIKPKHEEKFPYQCPVPGCGKRFKTLEELLMHIDAAHPEYAEKYIHKKDPFTGEEIPEEYQKSLYLNHTYLKAQHPEEFAEIERELGISEEEFNLTPLIGYTAAAVAIYVAGGFLPKKFEKVKVLAVIPGLLAAWEGYKLFSQMLPGGES